MVEENLSAAALSNGKRVAAHLLLIAEEAGEAAPVQAEMEKRGFSCATATYAEAVEAFNTRPPDSMLVFVTGREDTPEWRLVQELKKLKNLPVVAIAAEQAFKGLDQRLEIDDFIVAPPSPAELVVRIARLLHKPQNRDSADLIKCDGLVIDLVTCEVTIDGNKADLTFKEFELLKLMAANKGRVFTRQALLDKIWGYDYFGGDRTVDVHVRRLRSKIEDASHTYIETVRNIGYRFIKSR
jgi:two-component system, OmpR family, alkaline phosphatase synthesis response regulator PhoP